MTELVRLVASTGLVLDVVARRRVEPVSLLITGDPGTGKTELLKRFRANLTLEYKDDLTWMGLVDTLHAAKRHSVTHIVFPELNKVLDRRSDVWQNCMGLLAQAIEDGVYDAQVGARKLRFDGVRVGMIAGITGDSWDDVRAYFEQKGLKSRILVINWEPTTAETNRVMSRANRGNLRDLKPIALTKVADPPIPVSVPIRLGDKIQAFINHNYHRDHKRRFFQFRALACAAALLRVGPSVRVATPEDWQYVMDFDIWKREALVE